MYFLLKHYKKQKNVDGLLQVNQLTDFLNQLHLYKLLFLLDTTQSL